MQPSFFSCATSLKKYFCSCQAQFMRSFMQSFMQSFMHLILVWFGRPWGQQRAMRGTGVPSSKLAPPPSGISVSACCCTRIRNPTKSMPKTFFSFMQHFCYPLYADTSIEPTWATWEPRSTLQSIKAMEQNVNIYNESLKAAQDRAQGVIDSVEHAEGSPRKRLKKSQDPSPVTPMTQPGSSPSAASGSSTSMSTGSSSSSAVSPVAVSLAGLGLAGEGVPI